MTVNRPQFLDLTHAAVDDQAYDVLEPKYDGMWVTCVVRRGVLTLYSRSGRAKHTARVSLPDMVAVGEYLVGTTWACETGRKGQLVLFDLLSYRRSWWRRVDTTALPLAQRRAILARLLASAPTWIMLNEQHAVADWRALWATMVEQDGWEGLVFKQSDAPYGRAWGRLKRVMTTEYVCTGVNPGTGRYAGQAGSLRAALVGHTEEVCSVGGLTADLRQDAWQHPDRYVGCTFEAAGNTRFPSGALRHPRFIRWSVRGPSCQPFGVSE